MSKKFEYTLESLLSKKQADRDAIAFDEAQARAAVESIKREIAEIDKGIAQLENTLRRILGEGSNIDPMAHQRAVLYRKTELKRREEKVEQLRQANAIHERILRQFEEARKDVKVLEKNKSSQKTRYHQAAIKIEQKQSDELWLLRQQTSSQDNPREPLTEGENP